MMNCAISLRVKPQSGRTIIEIMISLTIGLIIIAAVMGAFVSSQQSANQTNASAKLTQEIIAAMNVLGQNVRQAGASDLESSTATGDRARRLKYPVISGCDGGYALAGNSVPLVAENTGCNSSAAGSDAFTVGLQVQAVNCTSSSAVDYYSGESYANSSWGKDVLGACVQAVLNPQGIAVSEVMQRFFVHTKVPTNANPNPTSNLYARTNAVGGTPPSQNNEQPLFPSMEQMRVRYLVSSLENAEGDVYMTATQLNLANNWRNVVGARICIVMSTQDNGVAQTASNTYTDCDGVVKTGMSNKLYRSSTALYLIRSRATPMSHTSS